MQLAESIVHLSAVVTVRQLAIPLVVARVKQTVRADVIMDAVLLAILDVRTSVGEAAPMDALPLVL